MNAHESYVSLETAKMLKKAGFEWACPEFYLYQDEEFGLRSDLLYNYNRYPVGNDPDGCFSAPTLAVAQRWLREVKHYVVEVNLSSCYDHFFCDLYYYKPPVDGRWVKCMQEEYDTYEEALEKGIQKCLTLLLED